MAIAGLIFYFIPTVVVLWIVGAMVMCIFMYFLGASITGGR